MRTLDRILVGISLVGSLAGFAGCEEKRQSNVAFVETIIPPDICKNFLWMEIGGHHLAVYCKNNDSKDIACKSSNNLYKEWKCYTLTQEAR